MNTNPYASGGTNLPPTNLPPPPPPIYYPPTLILPNYQQTTAPQQGSVLQQQSILNASNVPASTQYAPPHVPSLQSSDTTEADKNKLELDGESEDTASPTSVVNKPTQQTPTVYHGNQPAPQYQQAPYTQSAHTAYQVTQNHPQYQQEPYQQCPVINASNAEEPSSEIGYGFFGLIIAILFGLFAFCFLCCQECMGLVGQRKKSFIIGAAIGVLLQSVIYIFLSFS